MEIDKSPPGAWAKEIEIRTSMGILNAVADWPTWIAEGRRNAASHKDERLFLAMLDIFEVMTK